jgi:hypothetical protein
VRIASPVRDPREPKNCEGSGYHNSEHTQSHMNPPFWRFIGLYASEYPLMNDDSRYSISI